MKNDFRAFVELSWDDQSADVVITAFHEGDMHEIGIRCEQFETEAPDSEIDRMDMVKQLLIQTVENL